MNSAHFRVTAVLVAVIALAATWAVTHAHEPNGDHWSSSPVDYYDVTDNYGGNVSSRRWDFNSAVDDVSVNDGGSGSEVQITDFGYGTTGWDGQCTWPSGLWNATMFIKLNETYMEGYSGNKRSAVVAHEFGHCFGGVDHHESTGRIMQSCSCDYYDDDGVWGIDSGTASEIDSLW